MCGIAGIMYRGNHATFETGDALVRMLDACQHRGPDSTGFALYADPQADRLRLPQVQSSKTATSIMWLTANQRSVPRGFSAILRANAGEASMMARCTGKTRLHNLEPEDLRSVTLPTAAAMGIPLTGHRATTDYAGELKE